MPLISNQDLKFINVQFIFAVMPSVLLVIN